MWHQIDSNDSDYYELEPLLIYGLSTIIDIYRIV